MGKSSRDILYIYVILLELKITKIFHPVVKSCCTHTTAVYHIIYLIVYFGLYVDQSFCIYHTFNEIMVYFTSKH